MLNRLATWLAVVFIVGDVLTGATAPKAHASVFDLPAFIEPGKWSLGVEPEVTLSNGTGAGFNLRPRLGINDLLDIEGKIGLGGGSRGFRLGVTADFEWFPDYENQPGIATAVFLDYYRFKDKGQVLPGIMPMVYKSLESKQGEFCPFVGIPMGISFYDSKSQGFIQAAFGTVFRPEQSKNVRFVMEAGFDVKNAWTYISGGATYFY